MTDEPNPEPKPDNRPRFFSTLNGWMAGLTGLILAVAALFAAWDKLFPQHSAPPPASSTNVAPVATIAADDSAPAKYFGDGAKIEWDPDQTRWTLTDDSGTYYYDDVTSPDDTQVLGYDKTNGAYLRWPIKGGMAEESKDDKGSWTPYLKLSPAKD
jgi:hypothetical protein